MKQAIINKIGLIVVLFIAFITLGGLGNIAVQEPFYWVAFAFNVFVYGAVIWNLWRNLDDKNKEG